ncbi:PQQ-dependent sugar dehydrogenase [Massilia agilis]|uniref:PQQ-dependent sugar dehydrogenase n=1 Tax=Massilia agilis TaxID=1811226 RepID=A0ABT2DAB2_9BURK|nr:PQQ-dependent sugar dehydrogenase [Massilia agilis]MCS0807769.1 PQQ-dependent sugar dehydrogenase [Massilia agilis]
MRRKILTVHAVLLAALAAANAVHAAPSVGQTFFESNCAECHTVDPKMGSRSGPSLYGLLGRKLGSAPGYNYTEALAKAGASGRTWTRAELDVFLVDPEQSVPGTTMPVMVPDKADREPLIDYLASLSGLAQGPAAAAGAAAHADAAAWGENKPGKRHRITAAELVAPFASSSAGNGSKLAPRPDGALPAVPPGFKVGIFATDPEKGRLPVRAPNGDIFLAEPAKGQIKLLRSSNGETAETASVFASGLTRPYGMAFYPSGAHPKYLYVANVNSVVRFPYSNGDLAARGEPEVVVAQLAGTSGGHVTRTLAFSEDGKTMFVSVGSATNYAADIGAQPPEPLAQWEARHGLGGAWGVETDRAAVLAFDPDGGNRRTYATGLRNCVGMLVYPGTGELMCSVNERDELGDNLPPDYVTRVKKGGFYGWPWYYIGDHEEPRLKGVRPDLKGKAIVPDTLLQAHSAPLGMVVYHAPAGAKHAFAKEYEGDIFLALHGSWNRGTRTGYKLVRVFMKKGVPTGEYEDFMTGMVLSDRDVWGRPAAVTVAADGALLVADDGGGVIWRIAPVR